MRSQFWRLFINSNRAILPVGRAIAVLCLVSLAACRTAPPEATTPPSTDPATALPEVPPPPPDTAFLALMTPEQTAQIRALGLPLVLPTAIPAGFGVVQILTQPDDRFGGYQILYRDGGDRCFLIEYTTGGIGGTPTTENRLPLTPPILGDGAAEYGLNYGLYTDPALREQFPDPSLISDWLPVPGGFVRLAGAALINTALNPEVPCTNLTTAEAIAVINSLAVISEDIQGDGVPE
ncbi:hypothetical protein [Halomicronema sp. CCY15110]|uniref:hypothetical protein n=1 Tax=Halomicronema sp. CCY15110 TaxID=2767773 RepID=UPI001951E0FA|nr:hypothetical protein [Halomicronema sp. CCY15110]